MWRWGEGDEEDKRSVEVEEKVRQNALKVQMKLYVAKV